MKNAALVLSYLILIFSTGAVAATYNGSIDRKEPFQLKCNGLPDYPEGLKLEPREIYGASLDSYIFSYLGGALGLYYFELNQAGHNELSGKATYFDKTKDWKVTHYQVTCDVLKWDQ